MSMKVKKIPFLALCAMFFVSCMTVPKEADIPEDSTAADITQKAQESFDDGNYRAAEFYYRLILKRFSTDESICTAADYEIAHIYIKRKKWRDAYTILETLISKYEGQMGMYLPPDYYKLAKIDYARAAEKLGLKTAK